MEGIVKWFNSRKGYGFIKGDDGEDYFAHHTAVERGVFLRENDRVSFEAVQTEQGKQARNVKLTGEKQEEQESQEEPKEEPKEELKEELKEEELKEELKEEEQESQEELKEENQ